MTVEPVVDFEEARKIAEGAASPGGLWPMPEQLQRLARAYLALLAQTAATPEAVEGEEN